MSNNYTDTNLSNLIINKLTKQQYENLIPDENQLYITDEGIEYDTELSTSSENAVQNKVITTALNLKANDSSVIHTTDYATNNSFGIIKPDNSTITISNGVISAVGGSGADNVYWATYGTTTASQIASALSDNKIVACNYQNTIYLLEIDNTSTLVNDYKFTSIRGNLSLMLILDASNDTWDNDSFALQEQLTSGTNIKTINNTSLLGSGNINVDSLPSQSGNNGKFLTTSGSSASWATLPNATSSVKGIVQPDNTTITVSNGVISATDSVIIRKWSSST